MKRILAIVFVLLFLCGGAFASTRALQFDALLAGIMDDDGNPLSGGLVYFYAAGTTTAKNVYTDKAKTAPYTYVTLGTDGRTQVYGDGLYKVVVKTSAGVTYETWDNVYIRSANFYSRTVTSSATATVDDDFILCNTNGGSITITLPSIADTDVSHPLIIKRNGTNTVVIDGSEDETVDGSATYTITVNKRSVQLNSDGTNWQISGTPVSMVADGDGDTQIQLDEGSTDEDIIRFDIGGTEQVTIQDGKIEPTTDNDVDLGSSSKEFKDIYSDGVAYLDVISMGGVTLTPSPEEYNQLNTLGSTSISAAQWATLGALTASTTEVNQLDTLGSTTISAAQWAAIGGMADTVAAAELDYLDITTLGTSQDSKAVTQSAAGVVDIASHNGTDEGLSLGSTLITATGTEINRLDGLTTGVIENLTLAGWAMRPKFRWKDADEIYIGPGAYNHVGTVNQIVYWNQELTIDIGSPTGPDIYYLYIDDSAVVTADTNILTATEFIFSTSPPTYSPAQKGWYSSYDRCIFAVHVEVTTNNISEFYHSGIKVSYQESDLISAIDEGDIDMTWHEVDHTVGIPLFAEQAVVEFRLDVLTTDGLAVLRVRPDDSSASLGTTIIGLTRIGTDQSIYTTADVHLGTSLKFDIVMNRSEPDEIETRLMGWYMGKGM